MKVVDGKCPYCGDTIKEKPGMANKQINCISCGRLLNMDSLYKEAPLVKSDYQNIEVGILGSFLVGIGVFTGSDLIVFILTGIPCVLFFLVWSKKDLPWPKLIEARMRGASNRLRMFPFEIYVAGGWVLTLLLFIFSLPAVAGIIFCVTISASALMAVQANRLYRESKVTSTEVSITDFKLFLKIMADPSTAFDRQRLEKSGGESYSMSHFTIAEEEKLQKDQLQAENIEEISSKRNICNQERNKWEEDIDERYDKWLAEEYSRLKSEKNIS